MLLASVLRAAHRSDLPSFSNHDVSGTFGDPSLPRMRVVCLGDSSLTGPGLESIDSIFIRRLVRPYAEHHHVELISLAVGGSKAIDVIEGQLDEAVDLRPDIALVSVGSNDAIRAVPPAVYRRRMDHILDRLGEVSGAMLVLGMGDLSTIPRLPPALKPFLRRRSRLFDGAAAAAAASHPVAVKVWTRGRMADGFEGRLDLFAGDQFHAGDEGHRLFAEETEPAFRAAYRLWRQREAAGRR
ncbi:MAG: hypothetical protein KQH83_11345 [Actinobacteria bacterium]|nr:hypothetical protein [Actinomycetota bacterium]